MNQPPKLLKLLLLLIIAAGVGLWAWKTFKPAEKSAKTTEQAPLNPAIPESGHAVVVTYFTSDQRCPTCLKIEKQTREAVEIGFLDEMAGGELIFQTLNMDLPENKHFVGDYGLSFKTVVVSEFQDGKQTGWEKLDEVWDLVNDPARFSEYIDEGIRRHLEAKAPTAPDAAPDA